MPNVLTEAQVRAYERDGCLSPVRAMSAERARHYRAKFEALEARVTDIKKMKTKSHLLCPWVLEIAEDPYLLDVFEDLIGPNIRCWSMAWRVKKADGETFAGWHQDSSYGAALPVVLGGLALSECGVKQGCLRGIPGSHRWGILEHAEKDDPKSILARGQYITDPFDDSKAVDFELEPGEMVLFDNSLIHWIVNVIESAVEVRRDPGRLAAPARGRGYRSLEVFQAPAVIAPLAAPDTRIAVADLLL